MTFYMLCFPAHLGAHSSLFRRDTNHVDKIAIPEDVLIPLKHMIYIVLYGE